MILIFQRRKLKPGGLQGALPLWENGLGRESKLRTDIHLVPTMDQAMLAWMCVLDVRCCNVNAKLPYFSRVETVDQC